MKKLRVVLADDHQFVILGLRAALEGHHDIDIVGEAFCLPDVFDLVKRTGCDVLVTDLMMPATPNAVCDALGYIRNLRFCWPELTIIVITALTNAPALRPIVALGIDGLIGKGEPLGRLASIVRTSRRSAPYCSALLRDALGSEPEAEQAHESAAGMHPARARLSRREAQVLSLVIDGHATVEIARQLGRNLRTIKRQKRNAMAKIGVTNDPGLFAFVRAYGLP